MIGPVNIPLALVEGFAQAWVSLSGGRYEVLDTSVGKLVAWQGAEGSPQALPDRMYGLAGVTSNELDADGLPPMLIHLPPGVVAPGGEVHCLSHQLEASTRDEAWSALRRVGRQGIRKAQKLGCRVSPLADDEYLQLATLKAHALDGRPPHPGLAPALREVFGADQVGLTGVRVGPDAVAAVLWIHVQGYGMLVDGASDRAHWDKNPNNLAVWEAVAALIDQGCGRVDYGFSPVGAGDAQFKEHMGGSPAPLQRLSADRGLRPRPGPRA